MLTMTGSRQVPKRKDKQIEARSGVVPPLPFVAWFLSTAVNSGTGSVSRNCGRHANLSHIATAHLSG
jgi:hypothetical protein